ncbi:MAG: DUF507 family protein [Acidithiobacillales bacterium]
MARSRERAVDLSHRMVERLAGTASLSLVGEREYVRNHLLRALLEWDRENGRIEVEVRAKILARPRKPAEGSREWDLLFAEEMERAYVALAARGG